MANALRGLCAAILAVGFLAACGQRGGDTRLVPETRDGMFYLDFARAQAAARADNKLILLDMWRPG